MIAGTTRVAIHAEMMHVSLGRRRPSLRGLQGPAFSRHSPSGQLVALKHSLIKASQLLEQETLPQAWEGLKQALPVHDSAALGENAGAASQAAQDDTCPQALPSYWLANQHAYCKV